MSTVSTTSHCPQCGAALAEGTLQGLCPRCVARQAAGILAAKANDAAPSTLNPQPSTTLRYFGDYELLQEIAHGGMGVVWKARQVSLNRIVAVKLLLAGKFSSPEFVQRFRAEAEAAANLQHPNIVAIHEVGVHEGQQYFSMDYVDGQSLAERARSNPLPPELAADYVKTIAEAIHYAHQRGILHRDLKPSNILIDAQDRPRVTDFGLAKRLSNSELGTQNSELTVTGQVLGTPGFISPEQASGRRDAVTVASDIYGLGAILYFLLTGRAPTVADSVEAVLDQLRHQEPVAPRLLHPDVPRDLETICLKCLNKEPRRRYDSAQALADDLQRWLHHQPIHARPVSPAEKVWRWCRRKPALAGLMAALLSVGGAELAGILWQWHRAQRNADSAQEHAALETAHRIRAEEAVTALELQRIEDLFEKDEVTMAMAYLARIVRQQPTNQIAARRLLSALTQRNFALPVGQPMRHAKRVWNAEFSPDGQRVLTASLDNHAAVWDARDGQLLFRLTHPSEVRIAHFSPDGSRVVTVADDSQARLWDAATGSALGRPMTHAKKIHSAQFSPDGRQVLTASDDGTARLWNARTGEALLEPLQHQGPVNWAQFSLDGTRIVSASEDKTARVWDALTGQPERPPFQHARPIVRAEFSPDGRRVVTGAHDSLFCIWDLSSGEKLATGPMGRHTIGVTRFSPEGQRVLTANSEGIVQLWAARDWSLLAKPMRHRSAISTAEFSMDGQRILTASMDNTARLWDAPSGEPLTAPLEHEALVWSARSSPDGMFAVTASADQTARVWDVRPGTMRSQLLPGVARWHGAVFSPDGETVASFGEGNTAFLWNARTAQPATKLAGARGLVHLRWSPDGQRVAGFYADRTTWIWDARTGDRVIEPIQHDSHVTDLKFSPDGQWLATAGRDGNLHQWNTRTGQPRGEPIRNRDKVEFFAYSYDGQKLLCTDFKNDQARLHDAASGRLLAQTPERDGAIIHGGFSADGQRLMTGSEDGTARIWRADTLEPVTEPLRQKDTIRCAKFSHNRLRAVTASDGGTARVWNAQNGQPVGEPLTHRAAVVSAEFSPDDLLVVTASKDATARLWDATTGRPVAEPFVHQDALVSARFSPDGRRVLTVSYADGARAWEVPPVPPPSETRNPKSEIRNGHLLADLAEAIIGKRIDPQGDLENVSSAGLAQLRRRVAELPRDDFSAWLEWFFADRSTRTISPYSSITIPQYIQSCTKETNLIFWQVALMRDPTNDAAFAEMAKHYLEKNPETNSSEFAQADRASLQAVKFAPWGGGAWYYRRLVLERTRRWEELLTEADEAIQVQSANAFAWNAKAEALLEMGQTEAGLKACDRALEIWASDKIRFYGVDLQRDILRKRASAFRRLGRLAEASADHAESLGLARRDPQAGANLIDLGLFYNGGHIEDFPGSVQRLAGTDFDFRGWIHLDMRLVKPEVTNLPERVNGIPIEQPCRRLHFLHTLTSSSYRSRNADNTWEEKFHVPLGTVVGRYVIHYADGQQADIPIIYGRDVRDWWHYAESAPDDPALVVAWTGSDSLSRRHGATTRLYRSTWENPRPGVAVRSLDFVHAKTHAIPILLAVTADP